MTTIQKIQKMPEHKREQILWAIVGSMFVLMLLLWVVTSRIPRSTHNAQDFARSIKERLNKASADIPK